MDVIVVASRLGLAGAAVGEVLDLPGWRKVAHAFGVPTSLANPTDTALPVAELRLGMSMMRR